MAIDERSRHRLFLRLEAVLGEQDAEVLMEHLPPVGWADVATKRDVDALSVATKRDLDALSVATKRDFEALSVATKRDFEALSVATNRDLDALSVATKRDLDALERVLETSWRAEIRGEINRLVLWCAPMILTGIGLTFAAARLT